MSKEKADAAEFHAGIPARRLTIYLAHRDGLLLKLVDRTENQNVVI